jgi:hypothetical protein
MDVKKMVEYISKNGSTSKSQGEQRDCAVRAIAAAFDVSYDDAHDFAKTKWKRKRGQGTRTYSIIQTLNNSDNCLNLFGKKTKIAKTYNEYKTKNGLIRCNSKLGKFAKNNSVGTYYVLVRGHATVVKNGVILDNYAPGSIVKKAWEIEDINK